MYLFVPFIMTSRCLSPCLYFIVFSLDHTSFSIAGKAFHEYTGVRPVRFRLSLSRVSFWVDSTDTAAIRQCKIVADSLRKSYQTDNQFPFRW